jgi:hypothetical protein
LSKQTSLSKIIQNPQFIYFKWTSTLSSGGRFVQGPLTLATVVWSALNICPPIVIVYIGSYYDVNMTNIREFMLLILGAFIECRNSQTFETWASILLYKKFTMESCTYYELIYYYALKQLLLRFKIQNHEDVEFMRSFSILDPTNSKASRFWIPYLTWLIYVKKKLDLFFKLNIGDLLSRGTFYHGYMGYQ